MCYCLRYRIRLSVSIHKTQQQQQKPKYGFAFGLECGADDCVCEWLICSVGILFVQYLSCRLVLLLLVSYISDSTFVLVIRISYDFGVANTHTHKHRAPRLCAGFGLDDGIIIIIQRIQWSMLCRQFVVDSFRQVLVLRKLINKYLKMKKVKKSKKKCHTIQNTEITINSIHWRF